MQQNNGAGMTSFTSELEDKYDGQASKGITMNDLSLYVSVFGVLI